MSALQNSIPREKPAPSTAVCSFEGGHFDSCKLVVNVTHIDNNYGPILWGGDKAPLSTEEEHVPEEEVEDEEGEPMEVEEEEEHGEEHEEDGQAHEEDEPVSSDSEDEDSDDDEEEVVYY